MLKNSNHLKLLELIQSPEGHKYLDAKVYRVLLNQTLSNNTDFLHTINMHLKTCDSPKHKALVLYPVIQEAIENALKDNQGLKNKVTANLKKIGMDELLMLNIFLQLNPTKDQVEEFFKGGLFAVKDNGKLKNFFETNTSVRNREHDCSHRSITDAYSFQGELIPEFLFGDRDRQIHDGKKKGEVQSAEDIEYTWFQAEYSSLFGETALEQLRNWLLHKISFLIYYFTNENVGPYGTSRFKEGNPNIISTGEASEELNVTVDEENIPQFKN